MNYLTISKGYYIREDKIISCTPMTSVTETRCLTDAGYSVINLVNGKASPKSLIICEGNVAYLCPYIPETYMQHIGVVHAEKKT